MKNITELQRKTAEIREDLIDLLHAVSLNLHALSLHPLGLPPPRSLLLSQSAVSYLQKLVQTRPLAYMSYLMTRQIQEEQEAVRRERIGEYEEKIYDQRRIISDKEMFFQTLMRPKRKRQAHQTIEEFQEIRVKEKEEQEKQKMEKWEMEISLLAELQRWLQRIESPEKIELEQTKASSLSNVNSTLLSSNENNEFNIEKLIVGDPNPPESPTFPFPTPTSSEQVLNLLEETTSTQTSNAQLHRIYEQSRLAINFASSQAKAAAKQYQKYNRQLELSQRRLVEAKQTALLNYRRVGDRPLLKQRSSSLCKAIPLL